MRSRFQHSQLFQARRSPSLHRSALLAVTGLMAASCSGGVNDSPAASNDGATAGQSETQELVIGAGGDPWVDAPGDRKRLPNYPLNADVCETLVRLGTDFQLEPSLATDWEFVGDNTHRFSLDERATFSDGRPLTAKDVEFSLDYTTQEPTIGNSYLSTESTRSSTTLPSRSSPSNQT